MNICLIALTCVFHSITDGKKYHLCNIRPETVELVVENPFGGHTRVYTKGNNYHVKETPEQVVALIKACK